MKPGQESDLFGEYSLKYHPFTLEEEHESEEGVITYDDCEFPYFIREDFIFIGFDKMVVPTQLKAEVSERFGMEMAEVSGPSFSRKEKADFVTSFDEVKSMKILKERGDGVHTIIYPSYEELIENLSHQVVINYNGYDFEMRHGTLVDVPSDIALEVIETFVSYF